MYFMKKVLLLFSMIMLFATASFSQVKWEDPKEVLPKFFSGELNKPVLVDVWADWCTWCHKLDDDVYANKEVGNFVGQFYHAIKIDSESNEHLFTLNGMSFTHKEFVDNVLNIEGYPTTIIGHPNLKDEFRFSGYYDLENFSQILVAAKILYFDTKKK